MRNVVIVVLGIALPTFSLTISARKFFNGKVALIGFTKKKNILGTYQNQSGKLHISFLKSIRVSEVSIYSLLCFTLLF